MQTVFNEIRTNLEKAAESQDIIKNKTFVGKKKYYRIFNNVVLFSVCQKFSNFNTGTYKFIEKLGKVNYKIQLLPDSLKIKVMHFQ